MKIVYTDDHRLHFPQGELFGGEFVTPFERPSRVEYILRELKKRKMTDFVSPGKLDMAPVRKVHDRDFLIFLENAWAEWTKAGYKGEIVPTGYAARGMRQRCPRQIDGKAGYYCLSMETCITAGTWDAARASAATALTGQKIVANGDRVAFALCRPPGHHAQHDMYGGYCFLNNAAIGAQAFRDAGAARVAILDVDFHHGNGTQDIFYERDDVLFCSLHGAPEDTYPYFLGFKDEKGRGKGEGYNINYPMPPLTAYDVWSKALEDACRKIKRYAPDALVVSLGVDTYKDDPISTFKLDSPDFKTYGARIAKLKLPTLFVMEGGYAVEAIGINTVNVLEGFWMRDPRYDILFEPVKIGPVTAKNRFYQVPHCNGGGYRDVSAVTEMRRVKAEGGWAVIFTEQADVHPSSDITPYIELRNWSDADIPVLARMADAIHEYGALAGIELVHAGVNSPNLYTKEVPLAPSPLPILTFTSDPVQARAMDKDDIRQLRQWHRLAFRRAKQAGYDLICLYAAHGFGIIQHFLSPRTNQRSDEYGGSLENRGRLMREIISDAKDEIGDTCAVTIRLALDEMAGPTGFTNAELRDLVAMHADLPDLWDFAHGNWENCSGTSRFKPEAAQEELITGLKKLTPKPVVGVGRFTSPDLMVRQVKQGILDFVGAARPSIADPFLPKKIEEGRLDDIRECIGCNMCISGDFTQSLSRCTQNSSFMEEWRKGWHPERMRPRSSDTKVLIVGAGPAGLSAAHRAGLRGYEVALAEAGTDLGGRVSRESRLPGLSAWARVRDYRLGQITKMPNVTVYRDSRLTAEDIAGFGFEHVGIATGATWRRDGVARFHLLPIAIDAAMPVFTPDDIMDGKLPCGHVVVYDDDHYYLAGVLAELLVRNGNRVTFLTPATKVSDWSTQTLDQPFIQARILELGVDVHVTHALSRIDTSSVTAACTYTGREKEIDCDAVLLVTARLPNDAVYHDLKATQESWADQGIDSVRVFGDAQAPAAIAWATYAGHRYAEELEAPEPADGVPFKRVLAAMEA